MDRQCVHAQLCATAITGGLSPVRDASLRDMGGLEGPRAAARAATAPVPANRKEGEDRPGTLGSPLQPP